MIASRPCFERGLRIPGYLGITISFAYVLIVISQLLNKKTRRKTRFFIIVADLTTPAMWIYFADILEVSKLLELDN